MSMQSEYAAVMPEADRSVVPGVNVAAELVVTLIKPTKVVLAVTCEGTGHGSPAALIGPCVVDTVPPDVIHTANKQACDAAKAVPAVNVKLSVAALDLKIPLLVKVKVLVVLKVALLVPSARPAAVRERKPLLACSMLYDMIYSFKKIRQLLRTELLPCQSQR